MKTLIIANNLVKDYCGYEQDFLEKNINIGEDEIGRLFGRGNNYGSGPLVKFLKQESQNANIIFSRNCYDIDNPAHKKFIDHFGEFCIEGSIGIQFPDFFIPLIREHHIADVGSLGLDYSFLKKFFNDQYAIDLEEDSDVKDIPILLLGFQTERGILANALALKNVFGFRNVAVFSHFVSSANKEAHFTSLRYNFPDSLITVLNDVKELEEYLNHPLDYLNDFELDSVLIKPKDIVDSLDRNQRKIIESICMHWTEVELNPLGGGYSGSALFIAKGKQHKSSTEPMVIKIDAHYPIMKEVRGYNLVKDLLGKHIPTFTLPISLGKFSGVGMELAAMEGKPNTMQSVLQGVLDDIQLNEFLNLELKILNILSERVYSNTMITKPVAPYKHFLLHISDQIRYIERNLKNLERHENQFSEVAQEMIVNLFNTVRKNPDAITTDVCIGHGDLNFANIILDQQQNIWTIDWTHANNHPLEIDFAKMENDIKFVISKELTIDDYPKLQLMEEMLLSSVLLPSLDSLPEELKFISWDIRFKKIFLPIKLLRETYHSIRKRSDWIVYKIALLRYSLHTLSFDSTIDRGECTPTQLWYAYLSSENILFQLVADDYHLRTRSERPLHYPERLRLPLDQANWQLDVDDYNPLDFTDEWVLSGNPKHSVIPDPVDAWVQKEIISWGREYMRDTADDKPLNPSGRTGISGRGSLAYWGSNPLMILLPIRFDHRTNQIYYLVQKGDHDLEMINLQYHRGEKEEEIKQRMIDFLPEYFEFYDWHDIHEGYLYDSRETDNSWIDAKISLMYIDVNYELYPHERENFFWKELDYKEVNRMQGGYGNILVNAISYLKSNDLMDNEKVTELLRKTS